MFGACNCLANYVDIREMWAVVEQKLDQRWLILLWGQGFRFTICKDIAGHWK